MKKSLAGIGTVLLALFLFFGAGAGLARADTFCPPGQQPEFKYGFAFLKSQLGELMGQPLECEHYDEAGNAYQQTTTGQAFYRQETNTPMFTSGEQTWAWTANGLEQWAGGVEVPGAASLALKVMTYNVLYGAGATPEWEQVAANDQPYPFPGNRLPQIVEVIKSVQPDILAIEEAAGWDTGQPPIAQQVANDLGMSQFLARSPSNLHLVLFSRFPIVDSENLSEQVGNVGALRVTLALPDGQSLHVFAVHLDPFSSETRTSELKTLTQIMAPYLSQPAILMGDTNMTCLDDLEHCQEYQVLSQTGWRLATSGQYMLDQIWTSPALAEPVTEITFPEGMFSISDHYPVAAVIEVPAGQ